MQYLQTPMTAVKIFSSGTAEGENSKVTQLRFLTGVIMFQLHAHQEVEGCG